VTVMVFAVVMMVPAPVIMVMGATLGFVHQPAVEIRGGKCLNRGVWLTRPDLDAFLGKDGQRASADAATMMTFAPARAASAGTGRAGAVARPLFGC